VRRRGVLLLLLAASAAAGEEFALIGIRDVLVQEPDAAPPRTILAVDVLGTDRVLDTRRLAVRDEQMRERLLFDPFLVPAHGDRAYLVCVDRRGLRCLRMSFSMGEDSGKSFVVPCAPRTFASRAIHVVPERFAFLVPGGVLTVDLRLGAHVRTAAPARPLFLDPKNNRLYVKGARGIDWIGMLATDPPERIDGKTTAVFALPDKVAPRRAFVRGDALRVAYVSADPSLRADAERFALSVADNRARLLARRSVPGRFHDLRWLDDARLLLTTTQRETTTVHVWDLDENRLTSRPLRERYLAPPEIVPADLAGVRAKG